MRSEQITHILLERATPPPSEISSRPGETGPSVGKLKWKSPAARPGLKNEVTEKGRDEEMREMNLDENVDEIEDDADAINREHHAHHAGAFRGPFRAATLMLAGTRTISHVSHTRMPHLVLLHSTFHNPIPHPFDFRTIMYHIFMRISEACLQSEV